MSTYRIENLFVVILKRAASSESCKTKDGDYDDNDPEENDNLVKHLFVQSLLTDCCIESVLEHFQN